MIEAMIERSGFDQTGRIACPYCSNERKKTNQKDMTLTRKPDGAVVYHCHHCSASGSIQPKEIKLSAVPVLKIDNQVLQPYHYDYLQSRGISKQTADRMRLFGADKFFPKLDRHSDAIAFPYYRNGALVAVKYRSFPEKAFTQDAGGAHDFFGIDQLEKGKPIIIVEGEIDCLTLMEAGIENVVSVPSGAPIKVADGKVLPSEDKRFSYVWNAVEYLDAAPYVILATDQDTAGQALAEELARRIGKEKCRLAKFDAKDLNEIFLNDPSTHDPSTQIREILDAALAYPIAGLSEATTYKDRLNDLFTKGTGKGFGTGYNAVDQIYTVVPGQMTVVTGYPSMGKSNFVDQLMVNLAREHDWKFALCSFENSPEVHISRLIEIFAKKRFYDGDNKITEEEFKQAYQWVNDHFVFLTNESSEPANIGSIIERAKAAVARMGVRGLLIDPYNYIELDRGDSETAAISNMLTRVQQFAKSSGVHVWFVAHPAKINRQGMDLPRPDGMAISGSMAWWAKTDCGVTVHRKGKDTEIAVWKCRYRWVGQTGETLLKYDKSTGTYTEVKDFF